MTFTPRPIPVDPERLLRMAASGSSGVSRKAQEQLQAHKHAQLRAERDKAAPGALRGLVSR